jgi:hypothetical protein
MFFFNNQKAPLHAGLVLLVVTLLSSVAVNAVPLAPETNGLARRLTNDEQECLETQDPDACNRVGAS